MPVVTPPTQPSEERRTIERTPQQYATPVVDTRTSNYNTLATFASGHKYACDAYLRLNAKDTQPSAIAIDQLHIHSQLRVVKGYELLVSSPLDPKQGSTLGRSFDVTGTAASYSAVTFNEGDFFIADVGDGRNGIFFITKSTRSAPYTESMSVIEYKQHSILTPEMESIINSYVVEKLFFERELLRNGVYPLIKEEDVDVRRELIHAYRRLTTMYLHEFTDREMKTLVLPGQNGRTYDPYMTHFVLRTFDQSVCNRLSELLELTVDHQKASRVLTVLDALESLDAQLLYSVGRTAHVAPISQYKTRPFAMSIYYSGMQHVVAVTPYGYTRDTHDAISLGTVSLSPGGVKNPTQGFLIPTLNEPTPAESTVMWIKPVTVDTHYIFSQAFYEDSPNQSVLERITRDRLEHKTFSLKELATIAKLADKFDNLERYYYVPIILALIKTSSGVL